MPEERPSHLIATVADLEACIGKAPAPVNLKVIDHLDESALRWAAASPLMFAAFGGAEGIGITLGGGRAGFAAGSARELRVPLGLLDEPALARPGCGFGSLFLLPAIGETLRINGRVVDLQDGNVRVAVEECYVHCAKALIRSDFWAALPVASPPQDVGDFVAAGRFMALATVDAEGHADVSPKGDPAGMMARLAAGKICFAERPGNRRADSCRNMIAQPRMALALLIPGSTHVAIVSGRACLTTDGDARGAFDVQGKTPALVTYVEDAAVELRQSEALIRANLWPVAAKAEGIDPAKMFVAHVKLNKDKGLAAKLAGAVLSVPGLMQKGLDKDYKTNLY